MDEENNNKRIYFSDNKNGNLRKKINNKNNITYKNDKNNNNIYEKINNNNDINNNNNNNNKPLSNIENEETSIKIGNSWRVLINNIINKNIDNKKENEKSKNPNNIKYEGLLDEEEEIEDNIKELCKNKNNKPKVEKKLKISDLIDITEINTSFPVVPINISYDIDYINKLLDTNIYLYGISRDGYLYIFDLKCKYLSKKKILEIEDISDTFSKDYQYDGTILYNTLDGIFILTGKNTDILYHYNSKYDSINKICKFEYGHNNGNLLLDEEHNRLFVFGGKETTKCEYYSFNEKKIYDLPDLTTDRANSSFIISNNKIYGFFGFSYKNNKYCRTIEYIDKENLDKWYEIKHINTLNENINLEVKNISTVHYKENNKILLYNGTQGDNEDNVMDNFYLYDTKNNSIDLMEKWNCKIMKYVDSSWRYCNLTKKDLAGSHFAKNTNFLRLPKRANLEGYKYDIYILIDYINNIHFIDQDQKTVNIFASEM